MVFLPIHMVSHWGLGVLFPKNKDGSFYMHLQWYDSSSTVGRKFKVVAFIVVAFSFFHICCRIYWDISNKNGRLILEMSQWRKSLKKISTLSLSKGRSVSEWARGGMMRDSEVEEKDYLTSSHLECYWVWCFYSLLFLLFTIWDSLGFLFIIWL